MTLVIIDPAIGLTISQTHDPFPPIEFGRRDEISSGTINGNWTNNFTALVDEIIQNPCNTFDGNISTFASAINEFNTIHVEGVGQPLINVTSSVEVKIAPNHYLVVDDPSNFGQNIEAQADGSGIAIANVTGQIGMIRISDIPFMAGNPNGTTQIQLYYIKVDGQYLIDPSCI